MLPVLGEEARRGDRRDGTLADKRTRTEECLVRGRALALGDTVMALTHAGIPP